MASFKTITIVGLGLMGGSLAAACRRKFPSSRVTGVSRSKSALRIAKQKKWIHEGTTDLKSGTASADLIILCTPVDTLKSLLVKLDASAKRGAIVTDVGSVKGEVSRWADRRSFKNIQFIGAHPMTGSHERGISVAQPHLYDRGFTFLIRPRKKSAKAYAAVKAFWKKISRRLTEVTAEEHDAITGQISHLPHLSAVCLALTPDDKSLRHAGTGFADATRIAQGHPSIWIPIFAANQKAVAAALTRFERNLRDFRKALKKGGFSLSKMLTRARKRRGQISL
jgi:prephenate dehydrogenase